MIALFLTRDDMMALFKIKILLRKSALETGTVDVVQFTLKYKGKLMCNKETCPQLHYLVTDESGASIVVEFKGGRAKIFDSIGVITNNPTYSDLKRKRYYFHTQNSRVVRMVELDKQPKQVISIQDLPDREMIIDISEKFTPVSKSN